MTSAVIFDFDGVLYPENQDTFVMYVEAAARTAIHFGFKGTLESALDLAKKSNGTHNESSRIFIEDVGIATWPEWLPVFAEKADYLHLRPDNVLKKAITDMSSNKAILTNAHANWLHKVITHIDLHDVFEREKMISTDQVGYQGKARSDVGFRLALDKLGAQARDTVMIEDMPKNLRIAKKMGMKTILVVHGRQHDSIPDWVDHVCDTTLDAIKAI